ncbi:MAG: 2-hydroxyacid dehydrogenase [Gammaproteobacteria bacterium]
MAGVFLDVDSLDRNDLGLQTIKDTLPNWHFYNSTTPAQVSERIESAKVIITNKVVINREHLKKAPDLELICVAATGTNNVDIQAARTSGIAVCNVTGYATPSVVQHVFTLILNLTTNIHQYQSAVQSGQWHKSEQFCLLSYPISEVAGKKLGIIGYGTLGKAVADVANSFGMDVLISARPGTDPSDTRVSLEQLLIESDIISIHSPLTDNTRNLISGRELAIMKSDALLINTARGGIVNEKTLAEALLSGTIGGAGIDVLSQEPPIADNPLLNNDIPNLIVTPHIAWASKESRQRLVNEIAKNINAWKAGQPRNVV